MFDHERSPSSLLREAARLVDRALTPATVPVASKEFTMLKLFEAARRVSVPILVVRTADQFATVETIRATSSEFPIVQHDAARGLTPVNKEGKAALDKEKIKADDTISFVDAMMAIRLLPKGAIVCVHNAIRQLASSEPVASAAAVQAVANLRDEFKVNFRMLVLLGPIFVTPPELEHDVVTIDHGLPGPDELTTIVTELHNSAKQPKPKPAILSRAIDAVSGLSSFAAEQVVAMSMTEQGLDLDALWERKRTTIEQTRGLAVWRGKEAFTDLVGLDSIKEKLRRRMRAKTPVGVIVYMDEIDKIFANVESDTSGVRMDQMRSFLVEMENNEWRGMVCVGVPGGGKSAIAKAFGNECGVPTIALDLGDMEGSLVGESEARVRHAMAVIKAIGRGHAYIIATSNNATIMRPELQRRFTDGMFFFDVMTAEERDACWKFYAKKYGIKDIERPEDDGWTGAEIRNCVREAWDTDVSLREAARFIVPMAQSRVHEIEELRQYAHGRFLDASRPGPYVYSAAPLAERAKNVRAIHLATGSKMLK